MQQRPGGGFNQQGGMGSAPGPGMMGPRSQQQPPYSPMRQGGMTPQSGKRPTDSRPPPPQSKGYCFFLFMLCSIHLLYIIYNNCQI